MLLLLLLVLVALLCRDSQGLCMVRKSNLVCKGMLLHKRDAVGANCSLKDSCAPFDTIP